MLLSKQRLSNEMYPTNQWVSISSSSYFRFKAVLLIKQIPEAPSLLLAVAEHQQTCGAAMSCKKTQPQILQIQISMSKELELPTLTAHLPRGAFAKEAGSGSWLPRKASFYLWKGTIWPLNHISRQINSRCSREIKLARLTFTAASTWRTFSQPDSQSFKEHLGYLNENHEMECKLLLDIEEFSLPR